MDIFRPEQNQTKSHVLTLALGAETQSTKHHSCHQQWISLWIMRRSWDAQKNTCGCAFCDQHIVQGLMQHQRICIQKDRKICLTSQLFDYFEFEYQSYLYKSVLFVQPDVTNHNLPQVALQSIQHTTSVLRLLIWMRKNKRTTTFQ